MFGGPVWTLEVLVRARLPTAATCRHLCQARSVTAGAGLDFCVPGTLIGPAHPNQHLRVVYRQVEDPAG